MNLDRLVSRATLAMILLVSADCAARRPLRFVGQPAPSMGIYAGRLQERGEAARPFRLMLFVAQPDRIHGEILSPLGTPEVVLDGGQGRLAITLVDEHVTYQGPASAEALARVLGLRLGLADLVRAVLTGDVCPDADGKTPSRVGAGEPGCRVRRSPDPDGELPEWLEIEAGESRLTLRLKRLHRLPGGSVDLGTGEAPRGTLLRPIDEFALEGV